MGITKKEDWRTRKRKETMRWLRNGGAEACTDAWSGWMAGKAGISWDDYLKEKKKAGKSNPLADSVFGR